MAPETQTDERLFQSLPCFGRDFKQLEKETNSFRLISLTLFVLKAVARPIDAQEGYTTIYYTHQVQQAYQIGSASCSGSSIGAFDNWFLDSLYKPWKPMATI